MQQSTPIASSRAADTAEAADARPSALESRARRRAGAKLGWLIHAAAYVGVNVFLAALSASHGKGWAVYPALGWGLGLLLHGAAVWLRTPMHGVYDSLLRRERAALERAEAQAPAPTSR